MPRPMRHSLGAIPLVIALAGCTESASMPTQAGLALVTPLSTKSAAASTSNVAVTTTVADDPAFQVQSDGSGPYANSKTLSTVIQRDLGDWTLDLTNSARAIYLDFSRGIPGSGPDGGDPVPIPSGLYKPFAIARCHLYNNSFLTIAPGQTVSCPLHLAQFYIGAQEYYVQMNPYETTSGNIWPETDYVNVTCTSTAAPCASWTITPSSTAPDGTPANVAALLAVTSTTYHGKTTTTRVKQGDFYMSFQIDVTNP